MSESMTQPSQVPFATQQQGASLIIVLLIMVVVSLLGVGSAQIVLMGERGARNDRDQQVAWQSAEAALVDAESDIFEATGTHSRTTKFDGKTAKDFAPGCGTSTSDKTSGLCALVTAGKPAWLTVDFTSTAASAPTAAFGTFTDHTFAAGGAGIQPAQAPRYMIELVPDPSGDASNPSFIYRVTAMGFGPRVQTQAVLQILYRK